MGKGGARAFSEARGRDRVPGGGCALSLAGEGNTRAWGGDAGMWATRETWGGAVGGTRPPRAPRVCREAEWHVLPPGARWFHLPRRPGACLRLG